MNTEILVPCISAAIAAAVTLFAAWRWRGGRYLCDNCKFNDPDLCHKTERPKAIICKAYKPLV